MARTRRIIRKLDIDRHTPVDDQLWPLVVAMFVLGGFFAGTVLAYLRPDDTRWYANAWTWLIAIPLLIGTALVWIGVTGNRVLRRTMQLAMVLCAIVHIGLFVLAVETTIFQRVWMAVVTRTDPTPPQRVARVHEYFAWQHDPQERAKQDFEQPVETDIPDPQPEVDPHRDAEQQPAVVQQQPRPIPQPEQAIQPEIVARQPDSSVPRFREQAAQLSRRSTPTPKHPNQSAIAPDVPRPRAQHPDAIAAQQTPLPPRTVAATPARPTASATPRLPRQITAATSKSSAQQQPGPSNSAPSMPRRDNSRTRPAPLTPKVTGPQVAARRPPPTAPAPRPTASPKQVTRAPLTPRNPNRVPQDQPERVSTRSVTRATQASPSTPAARTPQPVPNRRRRLTERPAIALAAEQPQTVIPKTQTSAAPQPAAVAVQRIDKRKSPPTPVAPAPQHPSAPIEPTRLAVPTPSPDPTTMTTQMAVSDPVSALNRSSTAATLLGTTAQRVSPPASTPTAKQPSLPQASSMALTRTARPQRSAGNAAAVDRALASDSLGDRASIKPAPARAAPTNRVSRPSLNPQARTTSPPRRSLQNAVESASPSPIESPSAAQVAAATVNAQPSPQALALNKANVGIAGGGTGRNAGRSANLASGQAVVPAASATRAEAIQTIATGPALSPSAPTLARSGRADRMRPSVTRAALATESATSAGSRRPAELSASASAALTQAASNAKRGAITASSGETNVDIGAAMIVTGSGTARADSGGQPDPQPGDQLRAVPRTALGVPAVASVASTRAAPTPQTPRQDGGGQWAGSQDVNMPRRELAAVTSMAGSAIGLAASAPSGPESAPTKIAATVVRRSRGALDSLESDQPLQPGANSARRNSRPRQIPVDTGVADLNVGTENMAVRPAAPAKTELAQQTGRARRGPTATNVAGTAPTDNADPAASAALARATSEATDGLAGPPAIGGGNANVPRRATGPEITSEQHAEIPELAGTPNMKGNAPNAPADGGEEQADPPSIVRNQATPTAALANKGTGSDSNRPGDSGATPQVAADRAAATDGPGSITEIAGAGPPRRSETRAPTISAAGPAAAVDVAAMPAAARRSESPSVTVGRSDPGPQRDPGGRPLPVRVAHLDDVGGIGPQVTIEVGVPRRHARKQSDQVQLDTVRFARRRAGGIPDFNTVAVVTAEPFRQRVERGNTSGRGDVRQGPGPETEQAIELGLVFLSRCQAPDGSWNLDHFATTDGLPAMASDAAATGLALLAFQGAGYHHRDYRYADAVRRGLEFLIQNQQPSGELFVPMDEESNRVVRFYSHGIATLALTEAYGMTQDPWLKPYAQKAIDYIVKSQNPERGGWRYTPGVSSDTSVTGWMLMALKSGDLANLEIPKETYQRMRQWLDRAQVSPNAAYLYCYNPYAPDTPTQRQGRLPTKTMTSVGLLMRLYLSWKPDDPNMIRGAEFLLESPPAIGTQANPERDTYYWYYATQVLYHMGGSYWTTWWNKHLHPLLVESQIRDGEFAGSWDPLSPVPDRWAAHAGRLYVTTMNLLSLEVYYRHLPLYKMPQR